jgi:DNA invertase Pin-like site-specific DNA recombinase
MKSIARVALYLRVSTQDQSTELQSNELLKYIEARGLPDPIIYQDKSTGTNGNRPAFKQLMADIRQRKVDLVICWKLDRLFRSLKDLIATLQEWNELGVEFISLKDNIDLTTSAGRLMLHIIGAFGEFEASLIRERVRAGLANAKAHGKRLGRPPTIDAVHVRKLRAAGLSSTPSSESVFTKTQECRKEHFIS